MRMRTYTQNRGLGASRRAPRALGALFVTLFCLLISLFVVPADAVSMIEFDLVFQTKCVFEDVIFEGNTVFVFESYQMNNRDVPVYLSVRVHDPTGKEIHSASEVATHQKNFDKLTEGRYKICFTAKNYHTAQNTRVVVRWEEGADATDWDEVAKRDHTDAVHTELNKLVETAHTMHFELQHVRRVEEKMRDVNERTNGLVAFLSIGALLTCVGLAVFQVWSLRRFFKRKKVL